MGRLDNNTRVDLYLTDDGYDNGLTAIIKDPSIKEDKVLIIDADSIIHAAIHPRREEERGEYEEDEIETLVIPKIRQKLFEIQEAVSVGFNIQKVYCFVGGKGSYRKQLYPDYKANRTEKLPIIGKVYEICRNELNFVSADDLLEADDMLYILGNQFKDLAILSYIDKDLKQIPGVCYNYNKKYWYTISEEEARKSLVCQLFSGDASDNILGLKGIGPKKAEKFYEECTNDFSVMRKLLVEYGKQYSNAKDQVKLTYKLISLGTKYE